MICIRVPLRKEYARVVKWVKALSLTLVAPVRILVVCQSMTGVAYIQLTISNNLETGIGLAYSLRTSLISYVDLYSVPHYLTCTLDGIHLGTVFKYPLLLSTCSIDCSYEH